MTLSVALRAVEVGQSSWRQQGIVWGNRGGAVFGAAKGLTQTGPESARDLPGQHRHRHLRFRALGLPQEDRTNFQEPRLHGAEVSFDLVQVPIARVDGLRVHQAHRNIDFQQRATVEQGVLRFGVFVDGTDHDPLFQGERDKRGALVALGPALQSGQALRRTGARGLLDEGVTFGDLSLQLGQLVRPPSFFAHTHRVVSAHDQAFVAVRHLTQRLIKEIRLQNALLEEGTHLGVRQGGDVTEALR